MTRKTQLRSVAPDETVPEPEKPLSLTEAVAAGDTLAIMRAQRVIIAEGLVSALDNTRPQYSNELSKLNKLIAEEEARRRTASAEASVVAELEVEQWNGTGY